MTHYKYSEEHFSHRRIVQNVILEETPKIVKLSKTGPNGVCSGPSVLIIYLKLFLALLLNL